MKHNNLKNLDKNNLSVIIFWTTLVGLTLFLTVGFFYWTLVPYMQSSEYLVQLRQSFSTGDFSNIVNDDFIFEPMSNVQGILRSDFAREVTGLYTGGQITQPTPVLDKSIQELQDYVSTHPDYYTYILGLASAYSIKSYFTHNPALFDLSKQLYEKDMQVIKDRQDIVYSYASDLIQHGESSQAVALMQSEIAQDDLPVCHYQLGAIYVSLGESNYGDSLKQFEIALDGGSNINQDFTKNTYQKFMKYFYTNKDIPDTVIVLNRMTTLDPDQKYSYLGVLNYIKQNNKLPDLKFN